MVVSTGMTERAQPLRERLVQRQQDLDVSGRAAHRRAARLLGSRVAPHSYVADVLRFGLRAAPSDEQVATLAAAFDVSEREVRQLAAAEVLQLAGDGEVSVATELRSALLMAQEALTPAEFQAWQRALTRFARESIALYRTGPE